MNKTTSAVWTVIIIILLVIGGYFLFRKPAVVDTTASDQAAVRTVVENFGAKEKNVSLLSPTAASDIRAQYAGLVDPNLISVWAANPQNAPGRQTSSPWPDRIEVTSVLKNSDGTYAVTGNEIEATSTGDAGSRSVNATVSNIGGAWLISSITFGTYTGPGSDTTGGTTGGTSTVPSGWKTYSKNGITFQYPDPASYKYIAVSTVAEFAPKVEILSGSFSCTSGTQTTINGKVFCKKVESEGAAGSTYSTYTYTTSISGRTIRGTFTLQFPQCGNFDDPKKTQCQTERDAFNIDSIIGKIADSVKFS
jgi:hypothetical protein